jgi:hypothetical protein
MKQPTPRKNARRYDIDKTNKGGPIGSRISGKMQRRLEKAKPLLGVSQNSEVINLALVLLLSQLEEIVNMYDEAGIIPKDEKALRAFLAVPLSPEELAFRHRQYPTKVTGALVAYKRETMEMLRKMEGRLSAVEQAQAQEPKPMPMPSIPQPPRKSKRRLAKGLLDI